MDKPYPYQVEGAEWLAGRDRGLLADEPGLGKSAQVILAADLVRARQILIVPPATGRFVWKNEIARWSLWQDHKINVITSGDQYPMKNAVNIINYDILARGFAGKVGYKAGPFLQRLKEIEWDLIVADEAHYLKEQNSLRTIAILGHQGLNGHTKRLWLLTGTPMPNHPGELWTILASLGATELEYKDFIGRYCTLGKFGFSMGKPNGVNEDNVAELNRMLKGVMMRRYKQFVLPQLPPIRVDDFPIPEVKINIATFFEEALADKKVTLDKIHEQEEFVRQIWKKSIASGGSMDTMAMIQALEAIEPAVSLYRRWLGAVKAASFLPIIEDELETGAIKKVVIFAHHKQVIAFLRAKLAKFNPVSIDGSVMSTAAREKAEHRFQTDPTCRVFLGSASAREVITLTAAHEVVVLEPSWVPYHNGQSIMRCHRIGQKFPVRARFIRLADTLDDYVSEVLTRKTRDIVKVVDR